MGFEFFESLSNLSGIKITKEQDFFIRDQLMSEIDDEKLRNVIYDMCVRIQYLQTNLTYLMEFIPKCYKKHFVQPGENPFFEKESVNKWTPTQEDLNNSMDRMKKIMKDIEDKKE